MADRENGVPDHISFTQLRMWLRCQRQWYFRYVRGLKVPPPGAVVVGSAIHRAIQHVNNHLLEERMPPWDEVSDVYAATFEAEARDAIWEEDPVQAKDSGYSALHVYYHDHAPTIQPADVEREIRIPLAGVGVDYLGVVDLRTRENVVADYKTTRRLPSQLPQDVQAQVWLYQSAYQRLGQAVKGGQAIYIGLGKRPEVVRMEVGVARAEEVARWLTVLHQARRAMEYAVETGIFLPAVPGEWWCTPANCGYWDLCHREF